MSGSWELNSLVMCKEFVDMGLTGTQSLVAAQLSIRKSASANVTYTLSQKQVYPLNSVFPEMFEVNSLEKWGLDFSWRVINCTVCQTEKDMSSETAEECCISANSN